MSRIPDDIPIGSTGTGASSVNPFQSCPLNPRPQHLTAQEFVNAQACRLWLEIFLMPDTSPVTWTGVDCVAKVVPFQSCQYVLFPQHLTAQDTVTAQL